MSQDHTRAARSPAPAASLTIIKSVFELGVAFTNYLKSMSKADDEDSGLREAPICFAEQIDVFCITCLVLTDYCESADQWKCCIHRLGFQYHANEEKFLVCKSFLSRVRSCNTSIPISDCLITEYMKHLVPAFFIDNFAAAIPHIKSWIFFMQSSNVHPTIM